MEILVQVAIQYLIASAALLAATVLPVSLDTMLALAPVFLVLATVINAILLLV